MRRRAFIALPLLSLPLPAFAAAPAVSEVRAGTTATRARRMEDRLGIPVRAVQADLVAALDAGHLEVALLTAAELEAARSRMGSRLLVLPGTVEGRTPVTRRVLPPALRDRLAAAIA